jgi:hypothetical protein
MLPKNIRDLKQEAKKNCAAMKRVLKKMDEYLASSNPDAICVASAFFKALEYHIEHGDLSPENLTLATLLRGDGKID